MGECDECRYDALLMVVKNTKLTIRARVLLGT